MADNESTSVTKDLGIVSAYGYAKAAGYTGTEEEFEQIFLEFTEDAPGLLDRLDEAVSDCEDAASDAADAKTAAENAQTAAEAAAAAFETDTTLAVSGKAADAKVTGDNFTQLSTALSSLDNTVEGISEKNYTEGKNLSSDGTTYSIVDDANSCVSELIPITWAFTTSTYITFYYNSTDSTKSFQIWFYNSSKEPIGMYGRDGANPKRAVKYVENSAYIRFSFQKGTTGKLTDFNPESVIYWESGKTVITEGLTDRVSALEIGLDGKMSVSEYIDNSLLNRLNPLTITASSYINGTTGNVTANESYFVTDYIAIGNGETLYCYKIKTVEQRAIRTFCAYDKNKEFIAPLSSNTSVDSITQSGNMAFVRCSIQYDTGDANTQLNTGILASATPEFIPSYGNGEVLKHKYIRKIINIKATETETQIIKKLVDAYEAGNCDVYFERAHYSFGTALATVATDYNLPVNEIPVGHNCRYFFNGATLTATLDLSNLTPEEGDDEFYCNFFGVQRRPTTFEMHDGVLIATDTRYVMHDESTALSGAFTHLYENVEMEYHTSEREEVIRKCIGGGTGASGVVEIVGCKFTSDNTSEVCVSYHGNSNDVSGAEFDINVRNSWFSNCIRAGALSEHQTGRLFYSGNSATEAPRTSTGWTVTAFCNEIRT